MGFSSDIPEAITRQADGSGCKTGWTYFNALDETEQYDASGRLLTITNRQGMTTTLAYDPAGGVYRYGYDDDRCQRLVSQEAALLDQVMSDQPDLIEILRRAPSD